MREVVIAARGHPNIRATHEKTLEITGETEISERATCVVGVAAEMVPASLALLRGRVRATIEAAGTAISGEAMVNPGHSVTDRIVLRRGQHTDADTFAVNSTLVARDLPRSLVEALTRPDERVVVRLEEIGMRRPLLLIGDSSAAAAGRLGALWSAADSVLDASGAREPARSAPLAAGAVVAVRTTGDLPPPVLAWLMDSAANGARLAVLDPTLQPSTPLLAAGMAPTPSLRLGRVDRRHARRADLRRLLQATTVPALLTVPAGDAAAVLGPLAADLPHRPVAVDDGELDIGFGIVWTTMRECIQRIEQRADGEATVVLPPQTGERHALELGVVVRALARQGVPPRLMSEAFGPLGISRREVYDSLPSSPQEDGPQDGEDVEFPR